MNFSGKTMQYNSGNDSESLLDVMTLKVTENMFLYLKCLPHKKPLEET